MDLILGRTGRIGALLSSKFLLSSNFEVLGRHLSGFNLGQQRVETLGKDVKFAPRNHLVSRIAGNTQFPKYTIFDSKLSFSDSSENKNEQSSEKKELTLFQKMKQMTKDYWYILIPVHTATSIVWVTIFYIACKNGIDFVKIMESLQFSEYYVDKVKNSKAGQWAFIYALYKIFTPMRYTVTLGATTMSIRYLNKWGYLKFKDSKQILSDAVKKMRDGKKIKD